MSSAKYRPFCSSLYDLQLYFIYIFSYRCHQVSSQKSQFNHHICNRNVFSKHGGVLGISLYEQNHINDIFYIYFIWYYVGYWAQIERGTDNLLFYFYILIAITASLHENAFPINCWPVVGEIQRSLMDFPHKWPVMRILDVFLVVSLYNLLNNQSISRWFETPWRPLPNEIPSQMCVCTATNCFQYGAWRHQMEAFSALLALCAGNSLVTSEFPEQRPMTQSFDFFLWSAPQ